MAGVRPIALWVHVALAAVFLASVVTQFLLAGFALFGEDTWDAHEFVGFTFAHFSAILLFLVALLVWLPRGWPDIGLSFLVAALATAQVALPNADSGWVAGFHPLVALVLFVLGHTIVRRDLAFRPALSATTAPVSAPPP